MSVLDRIVEDTRDEVRRRRRGGAAGPVGGADRRDRAEGFRPFQEALTRDGRLADRGAQVLLPFRRADPRGRHGGRGRPRVARRGAAALSILTEGRIHFGGSLDDLREARAASSLPILRKDFIVDAYQVFESAAAGADAILLIVAAPEPGPSSDALLHEAGALDLDALVEVHDEKELEIALEVEADVLGINNRDLDDFSVDIERTGTSCSPTSRPARPSSRSPASIARAA